MQKADAEKWWPIIKEVGIKAEQSGCGHDILQSCSVIPLAVTSALRLRRQPPSTGLASVAELAPISDAGAGDPGICNGPTRDSRTAKNKQRGLPSAFAIPDIPYRSARPKS